MVLANSVNYSILLAQLQISDYTKWKCLEIEHGKNNSNNKTTVRDSIKESIGDASGIYLYEKDNRVLYIGKGKSISNRIYSHFRESFEMVSGDTKYNKWHQFFSNKNNIGMLKVYCLVLESNNAKESELDRQIIEKILTKVYQPEFESDKFIVEKTQKWIK